MGDNTTGSPDPQELYRKQERQREARRARQKKKPEAAAATEQGEGTVSDSVVNAATSPRPKKQSKQRLASAAPAPTSVATENMGQSTVTKARPVSVGGPMLPATPAKEQAYAGPTFHQSPAPSSLPMPKFFSRSAPKDVAPLQARMEAEKIVEKQESLPGPGPDTVSPVVPPRANIQSPLDMIFKADREEKARSRSNGGFLSPEMSARRPVPATEPRHVFQQSGTGIFLREMDGNGDVPSPRTVPHNSRPPMGERASSSPSTRPQSPDEQATKSLKDFLFSNINGTIGQNTTTPPQQPRAQADAEYLRTPSSSPFQRSSSGPSTPAPHSDPANYALHYGNRNLSPLFKAARNDLLPRPSGLRQELPNGAPPPCHAPEIDSSTFSRDFLNQHLQNASRSQVPFRSQLPQQQARPASIDSGPNNNNKNNTNKPVYAPRGVSTSSSDHASSAELQGSRDIGSMEDDLRRILKLNV